MTIRYGSSNGYAWSCHYGANPFRTGDSGQRTDIAAEMAVGILNNTDGFPNVMRGNMAIDYDSFSLIGWQYDDDRLLPEIWVIRNSDDSIKHAWEAESRPESYRNAISPFITTMQNGRSIISEGGSAVQAIFPSRTLLDNVQTLVNNASLPSWVTNTSFAYISTTEELLQQLFIQSQISHKIDNRYKDLSFVKYNAIQKQVNLYKILWMREASRILYDYRGISLIELLMEHFDCDANGTLSYK